jgi:hypothetical protein
MGQLISLIVGVIKTATQLRTEVKQDELDEDRRKQDKIKMPITPPKFYKTIQERKTVVKDESNPYSVVSIKSSLKNDVIPSGYSLEQLTDVGFTEDVREYNQRRDEMKNDLKKEFISVLDKIEAEIKKGFEDLSKDDRELFDKIGVIDEPSRNKILEKLSQWKKQINSDTVTTSMIDTVIEILKNRVDMIQDVFSSGEIDKKIQEQVDAAERLKTSQALKLVRRALQVVSA